MVGNSIKYNINQTQHEEYLLPCIKCSGKTTHKAYATYDVCGEDSDFGFSWSANHQIVQCLGCKTISFRKATSNSEDFHQIGPNEFDYSEIETLYPSRLEGRKSIGKEARYLPVKVRKIYNETLLTLSNQSPILAGIGLRALLETVCKEKQAEGKDLLNKIDDLKNKGILTPAGAGILHKIRTLGNAAAHEVKPHSEKQLGLAMDIVEHLLRDVYILPKQVAAEFDDEA